MNGFLRFVDGMLSFVFLSFLLVAALAIWLRQGFDEPGPLAERAAVVVPKGEGALEIAERLERGGIINDRRLFMVQYYVARAYGATSGQDRTSLKAGEYEFQPGASVRQVLDTIISGRGILQKVTIPEGWTSQQIVERLRAHPQLDGEIAVVPPEGSLLPDTYKFSRGESRQEILDRMSAEMRKLVAASWPNRQQNLPYATPEEALVLASIVEKETGRAAERARVAGVFVNRLRRGMRLQSDPTIIYGLVGGKGSLGRGITRADIDSKTPYNTYQIDGLPPGPICNVGRDALAAVLNPTNTQELFFVANGTGGHTFTTNLKDHNAAVQNWRRIERSQKQAAAAGTTAVAGAAQAADTVSVVPPVLNAPASAAPANASAAENVVVVPLPRRKPAP